MENKGKYSRDVRGIKKFCSETNWRRFLWLFENE